MEEKSPAIAIIGPKPDNFGLLLFTYLTAVVLLYNSLSDGAGAWRLFPFKGQSFLPGPGSLFIVDSTDPDRHPPLSASHAGFRTQ